MTDLPPYVVINNPLSLHKEILRQPAEHLTFPLSADTKNIIEILAKKFDAEDNCAGLAAPQIGFNKRIIIFAVKDDPALKKWRPDLTDTMPRTIWLNPTYEPIDDEKWSDYEACFSVDDLAGPVERFKTVRYTAFTPDGDFAEGIAHGFLARLLQHEIDHLNGKLFIDHVPTGKLLSISQYRAERIKAMAKEQ